MSRIIHLIMVSVLVVALGKASAEEGPMPVVASFSIVADWLQEVGGDRVAVTTMVPRGQDPHLFDPSPRAARALTQAELIVMIGAGMEPGIEAVLSERQHGLLVLTEHVTVIGDADDDHGDQDDHADHADHDNHADHNDHADHDDQAGHDDHDDHTGHDHAVDPHIWVSVVTAREAVVAIRDALIAQDPQGTAYYKQRWQDYDARLVALHEWVTTTVAALPEERRHLATNHQVLGYFARDYGFTAVGSVFGTLSTDVADPSPRQIAQLVDRLKTLQVQAIFPETTTENRLLQAVAKEAAIRIGPPLMIGTLGPEDSASGDYLGLMRSLVTQISETLGE